MLVTISRPPSTIDHPHCVNSFCGSSKCYTGMNCIVLLLNRVSCGPSSQSVFVFHLTNMHASLTDLIFTLIAVESIFKNPKSALLDRYFRHSLESDYPDFEISTTMSNLKSVIPSLLEVIISSKNKCVFIRDLSNLTLQIIFEAWWASMNVGSQGPIGWNDSDHAPSRRFYLHSGIEDTGSRGIICIICH
jgi:hypothetical protein